MDSFAAPAALDGIRIIDFSRVLAGPYCAQLLADYGADVIKVEEPTRGDPTRQWGPPWVGDPDDGGLSAYYLTANRNKRGMTLDLKTAGGQRIARQLIATADIVIENFMPGTMERLGLGYETLSAGQPSLIHCAISGYGQTGPNRDRPGYDFIIQAEGGIMSITGPADGEPHRVGVAIVDISAGLFAATAILAALHHRTQTGKGQQIDMALHDAQMGWLANVAQNVFATSQPPARYGNAHPNIVPYETFPTADGELAVGMGSDAQFRSFCELTERPELAADPRFHSNAARVTNRETLIPLLRDIFAQRTTTFWVEALAPLRIPAGPINDVQTVLESPQADARQMVQQAPHPTLGDVTVLGPVAKLSRTPASVRTAPPSLGADTDTILRDELGYSTEAIAALREQGVI